MDESQQLVGKANAASGVAETPLKDPLPIRLTVPSAPHRPGQTPCFAAFCQQPADLPRP